MAVRIKPGATQFTVMFRLASSWARLLLMAVSPPLAAV